MPRDGVTRIRRRKQHLYQPPALENLRHGAEIPQTKFQKATPKINNGTTHTMGLHKAAYEGDAERVKELLKKGANPNTKDVFGRTPLHEAASEGSVDVVKLLLEHGADPNIQDEVGWTPLHSAALWGHDDVVKLLLVYGADPTVKDKDERTPLDLARAGGHRKVVSVIKGWLRRGGGSSQRRF
jgi:ankyrin repeat protein